MTLQGTFSRVAKHLLIQNRRSTSREMGREGCAYYGRGRARCAVGCLIRAKHYSRNLEDSPLDGDVIVALRLSGVPVDAEKCIPMLKELQQIHDHDDVEQWPRLLLGVALDYRLAVPYLLAKSLTANA